MAHQSLDRDQINPAFEQMGGKGVTQGVYTPKLATFNRPCGTKLLERIASYKSKEGALFFSSY